MRTKVTLAKNLSFTKFGLKAMDIAEIIEIIRTGDMPLYSPQVDCYTLRQMTEFIRNQSDSKAQDALKQQFLPVATFNGVWDGAKISEYSNFTALDFDYITAETQLIQALQALKSSPFVYAIFKTFKPYRVKALVLHDNEEPLNHKEMYGQLIDIFSAYGIDEKCKDLSRKTFLPWDENLWLNHNCVPFHFVPAQVQFSPTPPQKSITGKQKSPQSVISILNSSWQKKHPEY